MPGQLIVRPEPRRAALRGTAPLVAALALALGAAACSRTSPEFERTRLDEARFACAAVDLGEVAEVSYTGTTDGGFNVTTGSCGGDQAPEQVFLWTVPEDGGYTVSTEGSDFDTVLYMFNGGCSADEVTCDDDTEGTASVININAEAGANLIIGVDGFGDASGNYVLTIGPRNW